MAATDKIPCNSDKILEGDIDYNRTISECLLRKFGANINALSESWKLDCKEYENGNTFTTPEIIFGAFAIAHSQGSGFNLNLVGGEVVSFSGQNGFTFLDNLTPSTDYPITSTGKITIICLGCDSENN